MKALGIETSTDVCSVGVYDDEGARVERSIIDKHIHSEKLLILIQEVLGESGISQSQLDVVAVSIGPGSFTGLRIGLSSAKGLCFSLDRPLAAVPTFFGIGHAMKAQYPGMENILVALDAKKGDFYSATFSLKGITPAETAATAVIRSESLGSFGGPKVACVVTDRPDILRQVMGTSVVVKHVHDYCRGSVVAELGLQQTKSGDIADVRSTEPKYLKDFVAQRTASAVQQKETL